MTQEGDELEITQTEHKTMTNRHSRETAPLQEHISFPNKERSIASISIQRN